MLVPVLVPQATWSSFRWAPCPDTVPLHCQAQARCHRIGQSKAVKVYRLITRNSYEREMFDKASLKLGLDKAVLQDINRKGSTNGVCWPLERGQVGVSASDLSSSPCKSLPGQSRDWAGFGQEEPSPTHSHCCSLACQTAMRIGDM